MALNAFVKMLDANSIEKLSRAFLRLDKEANGLINKEDFREVLQKAQPILTVDDIDKIFTEVDR